MLIYVPMAGFGERYRRAGHAAPKPLIPVEGRPMIERVVEGFGPLRPGDRFLFTVNRTHAETTPVLAELARIAPGAEVVVIEPHRDGPIRTLLACADRIPAGEEVVLNYCDFGVRWSFDAFRDWCAAGKWGAAMSAYRGFHPHSLGPTLYAYMRVDERPEDAPGARVVEIREKHHFTPDKFGEYASAGLFWFREGRLMLEAAEAVARDDERVAGELYVSTAMQRLVAAGERVGVYPLERFYQWGTAEDLADYESWARALHGLDGFLDEVASVPTRSVHVVPMAGRGQRFADAGFADPKPFIPVAGCPMVAAALRCLPTPARRVLVVQSAHASEHGARLDAVMKQLGGATEVVTVDGVTDGQATSAGLGVARAAPDDPVLVASCDAGHVYDSAALAALESDGTTDVAVFVAKGHLPARWRPAAYGWAAVEADGRVREVAVKQQVEGVASEAQGALTGTFWFRSRSLYEELYAALRASGERVNGELYVDTMARQAVKRGLTVRAFPVDKWVGWGTPDELATFHYWNDVFRGGRDLPRRGA
ncbi:MAG: NTP transferase domain-containing protein [Polyangiales bacterium]